LDDKQRTVIALDAAKIESDAAKVDLRSRTHKTIPNLPGL